MKTCGVCQKPINDVYGRSFIRIESVFNTYKIDPSGHECERDQNNELIITEEVRKTLECCNICTLTALKRVLIGTSELAEFRFNKWLEKETT